MFNRKRKIVLTGLTAKEKHDKLLFKLKILVWISFFKGENDKLDRIFDLLLFCDYIEEKIDLLKEEMGSYYTIVD